MAEGWRVAATAVRSTRAPPSNLAFSLTACWQMNGRWQLSAVQISPFSFESVNWIGMIGFWRLLADQPASCCSRRMTLPARQLDSAAAPHSRHARRGLHPAVCSRPRPLVAVAAAAAVGMRRLTRRPPLSRPCECDPPPTAVTRAQARCIAAVTLSSATEHSRG